MVLTPPQSPISRVSSAPDTLGNRGRLDLSGNRGNRLDLSCNRGKRLYSSKWTCRDVGVLVARRDSRLRSTLTNKTDISYHQPFEVAYERIAKERNIKRLAELFHEADSDGSCSLSLDEFREAMRKPGVQRTFSILGIQPHQSELMFRMMCEPGKELSIQNFITGINRIVGTDIDGSGVQLCAEMFRPTKEAQEQRQNLVGAKSFNKPKMRVKTSAGAYLGPVDKLSGEAILRAFRSSASSQALSPATARNMLVHRVL